MAFAPADCQLALGDRPVRSETVVSESGARVLTIATTSAELGLALHSTYTGHETLDEVLVAELIDLPDGARLESRRLGDLPGALVYGRSKLFYDHLYQLQAIAAEAGYPGLRFSELELGLERVEAVEQL